MPILDWEEAERIHAASLDACESLLSIGTREEEAFLLRYLMDLRVSLEAARPLWNWQRLFACVALPEDLRPPLRGCNFLLHPASVHQAIDDLATETLYQATDCMTARHVSEAEASQIVQGKECGILPDDAAEAVVRLAEPHASKWWFNYGPQVCPEEELPSSVPDIWYAGEAEAVGWHTDDAARLKGPWLFALRIDRKAFASLTLKSPHPALYAAAQREFARLIEKFAGRGDDDAAIRMLYRGDDVPSEPRPGHRSRYDSPAGSLQEAERRAVETLARCPEFGEHPTLRNWSKILVCHVNTVKRLGAFNRCKAMAKAPRPKAVRLTSDREPLARLIGEQEQCDRPRTFSRV